MKKNLATLLVLFLVMALLLSLTGCGPKDSTDTPNVDPADNTPASSTFEITIAASAEPETLDPQYSSAAAGGNVNYNIFDYIVRMSADGSEVVPALATDWTTSEDGLTWTFNLRQGVVFSNGEPFTADDVAYTLERMFEPDTGRTKYNLGVIASWEVVDENTINIITSNICNDLPARLYDMAIMPNEYSEEVGVEGFGTDPIGCGPYKLMEWIPNDHITIVANESYWGEQPNCTKITIRSIPELSTRLAELMAGTADIVLDLNPDYIATLDSTPGYKAVTALSKRVAFIGLDQLNEDSPAPLQDVRVRQAMNYAIDRDTIIDSVYLGQAHKLATLWREDYPGYTDAISGPNAAYPYDPDKARELLKEAGYENGFDITLNYGGMFLKDGETSLAIASYLKDVGINCEVKEMEYNAFRATVINGQANHVNTPLYAWNWGSKPQIPDGHLAGAVETGGISSYYSNPDVDALIDNIRYTQDETELQGYVDQLQALLYEDCPFIFLWQQIDIYGVSEKISWEPRLDQYVLGAEMNLAQ